MKNFWLAIATLNLYCAAVACTGVDGEYLSSAFKGGRSTSTSSPIEVGQPAQAYQSKVRTAYSQGGGMTPEQFAFFKQNVASGQTYSAILELRQKGLIGSPNEISETEEVYYVQGTGDNVLPPQKFVIRYAPSAKCNYECAEGTWD